MGSRRRDFLYLIGALGALKVGAELYQERQNTGVPDRRSDAQTPVSESAPTYSLPDPPNIDISISHYASRPNELEFLTEFSITDDIESVSLSFSEEIERVEYRGFTEQVTTYTDSNGDERESTTYEWNGESSDCSLEFIIDVSDRRSDVFEGRTFAGTESWIFAPAPGFAVSWSGSSDYPSLGRYPLQEPNSEQFTIESNKPAKIGEQLLYFGEFDEFSHEGEHQSFTLVVPDHANPEDRVTIFESLDFASDYLRVGDRNDRVVAFVATDPIREGGVNPSGNPLVSLDSSVDEFWFHASSEYLSPNNTWIHEYIHTRQDLRLSEEMEWFREASAEYYAALIMYQYFDGLFVSAEDVVEHLYPDPMYTDEVLTARNEWINPRVPYQKGAYILLALDSIITERSDSSLQWVFYQMNSESEVSYQRFVHLASEAASSSLDDWCDRYIRGSDLPSLAEDG